MNLSTCNGQNNRNESENRVPVRRSYDLTDRGEMQ